MKLIAEKQIIGDGLGCGVVRNLYKDGNGRRFSQRLSTFFWVADDGNREKDAEQLIRENPIEKQELIRLI